MGNLHYGRYTRRIVVGSVVDFVTCQCFINAQMVEMRAYHYVFIGPFSRNHA